MILISIVAFNRLDLTRKCVESVLVAARAAGVKWRLVLQNNASTDGTPEYFDGLSSNSCIHVINYDRNTGFQIPTEAAFEIAKEIGAQFLVCVNNDAVVPLNAFALMLAEFERTPTLAVAGCNGTCCSLADNMHGYESGNVEYIELSCAMIDVQKVARHYPVLFDPRLRFAYSEDAMLSLKMRKVGYTIRRANFVIEHQRGSTSAKVPEAALAQAENHAVMKEIWKHYLKVRRFDHRIIIRRWAALGDVVLVTSLLPKLWRENPLSEIVVETMFPEVFDLNPYVRFAARGVARRHDDMVIDLDDAYEQSPMRHIVTSYARAAGMALEAPFITEIELSEELRQWCRIAFPEGESWFAVHVGLSTWPSKNWPLERWGEVLIAMREAGYQTVLVGSQTNTELTPLATCDMTGKTTVRQLCALLKRCDLLLTIDSGPLHCAQAVGTPILGLFGATRPEFICTGGSAYAAVCSDPTHPDSGRRHREPGTMLAASDDVMRTISVTQVMEAVAKACPAKANV